MQISLAFPGLPLWGRSSLQHWEIHGPGLTKTRDSVGITLISVSYFLLGAAQTLWHFYLVIGLGFGVGMSCMGALAWHRTVIFWFDHWRGRAIAFAVMGASLAGMMMPP